MPKLLKKYDIENGVDNPKEGYIILGFDLDGELVYKDSVGNYGYIVDPNATTGYFERLDVDDYLTVGTRLTSGVTEYGKYSITQGNRIEGSGHTSYGQGDTTVAKSNYSTARGKYTIASNNHAYVCGLGYSDSNKLISSGINSFVHSYSDTINPSGSLADYSVILGGKNQFIGYNATGSTIIGGEGNTITGNNTAIIASSGKTDDGYGNAVYVPRLVLMNNTYIDVDPGTIEWSYDSATSENHFRGYRSGKWTNMDTESSGDVASLSTAVSTETSNRISADIPLSTAVSTETSNRISADLSIQSDFLSRDLPLSTTLSTEIYNRTSADSSLSTAIVSNNSTFALSISIETNNRSNEDVVLTNSIINGNITISNNISTEKSSRISGDLFLSTAISTESSSRQSGDVSLAYYIQDYDLNVIQPILSTEILQRGNADVTISTDISTESGTRAGADNIISTDISTESGTRAGADNIISSSVSTEIYTRSSVDTVISTSIGSRTYTYQFNISNGQTLTQSINALNTNFGAVNHAKRTISIGSGATDWIYNFGTGQIIDNMMVFNGMVEYWTTQTHAWQTIWNRNYFQPYFPPSYGGSYYGFVASRGGDNPDGPYPTSRPMRVRVGGVVEIYDPWDTTYGGWEWWYTLVFPVNPAYWGP